MRDSGKKKSKGISISKLKKKADNVFSKWIRERDKRCFTCGSISNLQNGHYVSRAINILRYDERNCNAQCVKCNIFNSGAMDTYALRLLSRHGKNILNDLAKDKQKLKSWTRQELEEIITKYKT